MANLDDFIQSAQEMVQKFDKLHKEHGLDATDHVLELVRMGEEDASVTAQMAALLQVHEADRQRLRMQVSRLNAENQWLREELSHLRKRFNENEQDRVRLEIEMDQHKFNKELQLIENRENEEIGEEMNDQSNDRITSYLKKSMCVSTVSGDIPPRLKTLHNLVLHYASQGKYEVAVPLCRQTLSDLEKNLGHEHPDVASMLNILALVYRDQGKFKEATELLYNALAIREKTLGQDSLAVAATLNNLAVLHGKRGKYKDAQALCERALVIREAKLGLQHPDVAKQLTNLAFIKLTLGDLAGTESCYERALSIYKSPCDNGIVKENDKILVAKTQISLSQTYIRQKKYKEAERILYEALDVKFQLGEPVRVDGPSGNILLTICSLLSAVYRKQGLVEIADHLDEGLETSASNDEQLRSILTGLIGLAQIESRDSLVTSSSFPNVFQQIPTRFRATLKRFNSPIDAQSVNDNL